MRATSLFTLLFISFIFFSCGNNNGLDWAIPSEEVFDGGPGKDGIPSVDNPEFISIGEVDFMAEDDLIVGFKYGNEIHGYPHPILDWHEIINDAVNDAKISIVYCPLTGTATGWNRVIKGDETTFGVSGLLYNTNIIPYDRKTNSNWSQIRLDCVNGKLKGEEIETYQIIETTWQTWKEFFPNSKIVSTNTGFSRNYLSYPYGDYRTNDSRILFPVSNMDERLPAKERAHGILMNGKVKAYSINDFGSTLNIIQDDVNDIPVVITGSTEKNFVVSFLRTTEDGTLLDFTPVEGGNNGNIMTDQEGNIWDIFGYATSGPRQGQRLTPTESFMGYWFAWGTFYPDLELY